MGKKKNKFFADWPASKSPRQGRAQTGDKTSAQKLKASKKTPLLSSPKESEALPDIDKTKVAPSTSKCQTSKNKKLADTVTEQAKDNPFTIPHTSYITLDVPNICKTFTQRDIHELDLDRGKKGASVEDTNKKDLALLMVLFKLYRPFWAVSTILSKFKKRKPRNKSHEKGNTITRNQKLCQQAILSVCSTDNLVKEKMKQGTVDKRRRKFTPSITMLKNATEAHDLNLREKNLPPSIMLFIESMKNITDGEQFHPTSNAHFQNLRKSVSETYGRDTIVMGLIDSAVIQYLVDERIIY